jgi:hypothetical protein
MKRLIALAFTLLFAGALATACFSEEPAIGNDRFYCTSDDDCLAGFLCNKDHPDGPYCAPVTEKKTLPTADTTGGGEDATPTADVAAD